MSDEKTTTSAKKTSTKKKKTTTKPKPITDAQLVTELKKVQRRKLSRDEFKAVTAVIRLLSE